MPIEGLLDVGHILNLSDASDAYLLASLVVRNRFGCHHAAQDFANAVNNYTILQN